MLCVILRWARPSRTCNTPRKALELIKSNSSSFPDSKLYHVGSGRVSCSQFGDGSNGDYSYLGNDNCHALELLCQKGHINEAVNMLFQMEEAPFISIYLSLLRACCDGRYLLQTRKIHQILSSHGVPVVGQVADHLVFALAKCGAIADAYNIADAVLPHLSEIAWTALISSFVQIGHIREALYVYIRMQDNGVEPSTHTFANLFKACAICRDICFGKILHCDALIRGITSNAFVASGMVNMYGKCGAIVESEDVFMSLAMWDSVAWNAMLCAYFENQLWQKTLQLYRKMYQKDVMPTQVTFVTAIQACGNLVSDDLNFIGSRNSNTTVLLEIGNALHADAYKRGFSMDVLVNNTLITMYGKLGAVRRAEAVFNSLLYPDLVSWNAILNVYTENSQHRKALLMYKLAQQQGVSVDTVTVLLALQACTALADEELSLLTDGCLTKTVSLDIGLAIHTDICIMNDASNVILNTSLLRMYGVCGALEEAEEVFLDLNRHDGTSYNALLLGYIKQGQGEKALQLYRQMLEEHVVEDAQTLLFAIQACSIVGEDDYSEELMKMALEIGLGIHAYSKKKGLANIFVENALITMYGKCGTIEQVENMFTGMSQPDTVSWNAMLSAYIGHGKACKALQLFQNMVERGVPATQLTFVLASQACSLLEEKEIQSYVENKKLQLLEIGKSLHIDASRRGFLSHNLLGSALLNMYSKCGAVLERDNLFKELPKVGTVQWNTIVSACIKDEDTEQVLLFLEEIQSLSIVYDDCTFICILQACSILGGLEMCRQLHFSISCAGYERISSVSSTLIHAYGGCSNFPDLQSVFDQLYNGDIVSWNSCIAGHIGNKSMVECLDVFEQLQKAGIDANDVTLTSLLSACSHHGFVIEAMLCFQYFRTYYRNYLNVKHYSVMIDLLGRAGDFRRLGSMLKIMPVEPDLSVYLSVLGACYVHNNVELAEWAFLGAVTSQPKQTVAYVLMANIYASHAQVKSEVT